MDLKEGIAGCCALLVVGAALWLTNVQPPSIDGQKVVPTKTQLHLVTRKSDADGVLRVEHVPSGDHLEVEVKDRQVYESPEQSRDPKWKVQYVRHLGLVDLGLDFGTYAGARINAPDGKETFTGGIRLSPCRLLYGTIAPDLLVGQHDAGVGLSVFLPPDRFPDLPLLNHIGVGVGRTYDYHTGQASTLVYTALSIRF